MARLRDVAIVSCDIVGHSAATGEQQLGRVKRINEIVGELIRAHEPGEVFWTSGGDGGHVVFLGQDWLLAAVGLIESLVKWSAEEGVSLRVTGHCGQVATIHGADGREQLVGSAINYAGWLMNRVSSTGVVVSDAFREQAQPKLGPEWRFREPWLLPNPDFPEQLLYLLSFGDFPSSWFSSEESDQNGLKKSIGNRDSWGVIRYAKRIWQADAKNEEASAALKSVKALGGLQSSRDNRVNPFLGYFDDVLLEEVIRLGQLVERRAGERVCRFGDDGDSLFVVLEGEIGVYNSEGQGVDAAKPMHRIVKGEVAGELAYALARKRTADLVALTDVSMLSFTNDEIYKNLDRIADGEQALKNIDRFIAGRVLEHVCDNTDYLLGKKPAKEAVDELEAWKHSVEKLKRRCRLIKFENPRHDLDLEALQSEPAQRGGVFILVAGQVQFDEGGVDVLDGLHFPVLWVGLPELLSAQTRSYSICEKPVIVLRVSEVDVGDLTVRQQGWMKKALGRELRREVGEYEYDVFLCHSSQDKEIVLEIYARLQRAGLKVWLDRSSVKIGDRSLMAIENGLKNARYLLACVGESFHEAPWAMREFEAMYHLDLKKRSGVGSIIPLLLSESPSVEENIRPFLEDSNRHYYTRDGDFERLVDDLLSSR